MKVHESQMGCGLCWVRLQQNVACEKLGLVEIIGAHPDGAMAPTGMHEDQVCGGLAAMDHSIGPFM